MLQHILLVGDVDDVVLRFVGGALYLVNGIAARFPAEDIYRAGIFPMAEGSFADDRVIFPDQPFGMVDHSGKIQLSVRPVGGDLGVITEQPHSQIADLTAGLHPGIQCGIVLRQLRSVGLQPQPPGALAECAVFGFGKHNSPPFSLFAACGYPLRRHMVFLIVAYCLA